MWAWSVKCIKVDFMHFVDLSPLPTTFYEKAEGRTTGLDANARAQKTYSLPPDTALPSPMVPV